MQQPSFSELAPALLKAWVLHMIGFSLAFLLPFIAVVAAFITNGGLDRADLWWLLFFIPLVIVGIIIGIIWPWRYLKNKGFKTAGLTVLLGVAAGLILPFGSILGFLGGYLLERDARALPTP